MSMYNVYKNFIISVILINVVRVLLTKLHPWSAQPAPVALKKATRATLILVEDIQISI